MRFALANKYVIAMIVSLLTFPSCTNRKVKTTDQSKPNIVFVLIDDQAWNVLGKDGRYTFLKTPNLDQLSREGLTFENAFVTTSLCSPSRACFLTGSYAHTHGVYINSYADPKPEVPMLPKVLQKVGYETAFMGKWHMKRGAAPREGFDYWLSFDGQGMYLDPPLNENGRDFIEKGYMTDILTGYATRWMKKSREKPFCLFLWHKAVHAPFTPAPRDSAAFPDALIPEYENWYDTMEGKPEWLRRGWLYGVHNQNWKDSQGKPVPDKIEPHPWDPQNPRWMNYLRAMLAVDESLGNVRRCLEELEILDNTIIVFASDNGFFLGSHQRSDKRLMYEESLRIPLIIRYPEMIKEGSKNNALVLNIDVAPTLIELAGATVPEAMQGVSMVPLFNNEETKWRESFFYEYYQESYAPGFVTATGVRNTRYKYIEYPDMTEDIDELYDLKTDPGEMTNLIGNPDYQTIKSEMKSELEKLKKETGYFDPGVYNELK
jgi:N-acetylglucosamine-6-sulfatase